MATLLAFCVNASSKTVTTQKKTYTVEGIAVDIQRNANKQECLKIRSGDHEMLIPLAHICRVDVLNDNPHLTSIVMA
nr:Rho-binding antiterminator [Vibrio methylphosphonaticus]